MKVKGLARQLSVAAVLSILVLAGCSSPEGSDSPEPASTDVAAEEPSQTVESEPDAEPKGDEYPDSAAALDEYAAAERAAIPTLLESFSGIYSDMAIEAVAPDTIVFVYTYDEAIDLSGAEGSLDSQVPTLEQQVETLVFPQMEAAGVGPVQKVTYTFLAPDGTELWTHTFTSE